MNILKFNLVQQGGPLVVVLLVLGFIGLVFAIERFLYLHKDQIRAKEFLAGIKNLIKKRRLVEALTVCEETTGPVAHLVKTALLNYNQPETKLVAEVQKTALLEVPNLERRVGTLAMIAKIAPLIGLLGTVIALYQGYKMIFGEGTYVDMQLLSKYVANALITTIVGLLLSILAYMAYHFLMGRVKSLVHDMEWVGHEVVQFLLRDLPDENEH